MVDRGDRGQLRCVLSGRSATAAGQARALLKQVEAGALAGEAERAAHGVRHLTGGRGDPESAGALAELLRDAADLGAVGRLRGR
jgi:hypothetical protein